MTWYAVRTTRQMPAGHDSGTEGRGDLFFQVSEIHIERGGAIKIMPMSVP